MADEIVIVPVADQLFSRDTLAAAGQLAKAAPERLTELHLAHLAHYVTPRALADLVTRRRQAAEAAEAAGWDAYNAGFRAAHGVHTGAVQPLTAKSAPAVDEPESWDALIARRAGETATIGEVGVLIDTLFDVVGDHFKKQQEHVQALEARVLELEAQLAVVRT